MRDKGIVITTQGDLAKVRVACFSACEDCSARSLCLGHKNSQGLLAVKNSLHADPGDKVVIEVPESNYTKALIVLFGSLVFSALLSGKFTGIFSGNRGRDDMGHLLLPKKQSKRYLSEYYRYNYERRFS